ncbi:protease inhibitor Inh/omp19 family protein [Mangrovicella endophytica]|uniref:protease inhibitor Inh/omp19 family protein n=1 Tax=Mangrovicella endophytica TaxID=2066697 RepID=UPI0012FFFCEB|nr:protease inhibitor Inh/omp19 family protein [Mangrovicella endophytica]
MTRMMMTSAALAALVATAGCQSSMPSAGYGGYGGGGPAPLEAAPTGRVSATQLPPPPAPPPPPEPAMASVTDQNAAGTSPTPGAPGAPTPPAAGGQPVQTASAAPVSREGLVGAWKVSSGGGNCQIFMALTKWTGGYRAASRGCPGQVADVSAWDVSGSQVVLKSSSGDTVASLNSSGAGRYDGQTTGGQSISLYR